MFPCRRVLIVLGLSVAAGVAWAGISDGLTDGLISAWTFDDGTANDIKGLNNGTLKGGAKIVAGKNGMGLDVNGIDAYVEIPHGPSMDAMESAFTHAAWAFIRDPGDHAAIMFKGDKVGWGPHFLIRLITDGGTNLSHGSNNVKGTKGETEPGAKGHEGWLNAFDAYDPGQWIHLAQVADGKTLQPYLNGAPVEIQDGFHGASGTKPVALTAPYAIFPKQPIILGMSWGVRGIQENRTFLDGIIDEAAIFNRALSDTEIARLADFDWATAVRAEGKLAVTWGELKNRPTQ